MAESLNVSEIQIIVDKNDGETTVSDAATKSITNSIIRLLELDENENKDQIVHDLLENGRQSLAKYEQDIIVEKYVESMNTNNNELMVLLKKYFHEKIKTRYSFSNEWFGLFLKEYENPENHDVLEILLVRMAEYGARFLKNHPILSVVLQLLFESLEDESFMKTCLFDDEYLSEKILKVQRLRAAFDFDEQDSKETNTCDGLWFTVTNDGLDSIKKYSDYIVEDLMNAQLNETESTLFRALREYYREQLFSLMEENQIPKKSNLYDLALDAVAKRGWLIGIQAVEKKMTPKSYKGLEKDVKALVKIRKLWKKQAQKTKEQNPTTSVLKSNEQIKNNEKQMSTSIQKKSSLIQKQSNRIKSLDKYLVSIEIDP